MVQPAVFLGWARGKGCPIPEELEEAVNRFHLKAEGSEARQSMASDAPLHESERDSLLKMVLGMAMSAYAYKPGEARNSATGENAGSISAHLNLLGLTLDADTVRKFIKEAETRFKDIIPKPQKS